MDDNNNLKPGPAADPSSGDAEGSSDPQVYDFSSDFNISPVKDEPVVPPPPAPTTPKPAPASPAPVAKLETATPGTPVLPRGRTTSTPQPLASATPITPPRPPQPLTPLTPSTPPAPTKPQSYREPIEPAPSWPFNPGARPPASSPATPATAPTTDITATPSLKSAPSYAPVKTIRTDRGSAQPDPTEQKDHPATDLQRDVLAILPNLKKPSPGAAPAPAKPIPLRPFENLPANADIKPLRTYETDVAEVMARRKTSTTSIAMAEKKKETGEERISNAEPAAAPAQSSSSSGAILKVFYILISLILIGAGAFGGYYLYSQSPLYGANQTVVPIPQAPKSLVPADAQTTISLDGVDRAQAIALIQAELFKPHNPGTITELILVRTSAEGVATRLAPAEAASFAGISAPDMLLRTLKSSWLLGVHTDLAGQSRLFALVVTDFFQNAFAGMLRWENTMANDLKSYIDPSSTLTPNGRFTDEIIKNKDVRTFISGIDGQPLFAYSFLDNAVLVIAQDKVSIAEVATRLENQAFVR